MSGIGYNNVFDKISAKAAILQARLIFATPCPGGEPACRQAGLVDAPL